MTALRRFSLRNPALAGWLLALVLGVKLLVPAGYMPERTQAGVVLAICSGHAAAHAAMPGAHHHHADADHADRPCPYADLTLPALPPADPLLLAPATAFAETPHLRLAAARARTAHRLRPPLRGPPLLA